MTQVRIRLYDNDLQRALCVFSRKGHPVVLVRWVRGPISRIIRLVESASHT